MSVEQLVILAVIVEAVVNLLMSVYVANEKKPFYLNIQWKLVASILVGEAIAFGFGADLTEVLGIPATIAPIGMVLTGLILGRGSNFVHDLLSTVKSVKEVNQQKLA